MGSADAPLTAEASMQGPPISYVGEKLTPKDNAATQLALQASILADTAQCLVRNEVNPGVTVPHWRTTDGIMTPDNQGFAQVYAKAPVKVATTLPITLSGAQTIDGVAVVAGDRVLVTQGGPPYTAVDAATTANIADLTNASVTQDGVVLVQGKRLLVKGQTLTQHNGIYAVGVVNAGIAPLTRVADMDLVAQVVMGQSVTVSAGTVNNGKSFMISTVPAILDTNPLLFVDSSIVPYVANALNGIYVVAAGAWSLATDANKGVESLYTAVAAATTANITNMTNCPVVQDGVTLVQNSRLLVKNQTTASQNGIYTLGAVNAGVAALTRAADMNSAASVVVGKGVAVTAGTINANLFFAPTAVVVTLNTDSVLFAQASEDSVMSVRSGMSVFVTYGTKNAAKTFFINTADPISVATTPLLTSDFGAVISTSRIRTSKTMASIEAGMYRAL